MLTHPLYDTTACCVVGGSGWNSLAHEPGPAKSSLVLRKRVSVAVSCGREHHQCEVGR